ncbi:hypothetical protein JBP901_gp154 [Bacillus phage JBP901]|uniref:Uncharacterized protein n=2 Tax=Caeruleovirus TaxID=1911929 RepID=A0A0E3DF56_9CAUD|nr:hypothetical protein JBP901_gp154 [Bacillus phage JBP901]YP_009149757.1 hypothetical protein BCP8-2_196 [Bacillus phage BCP8-2]ANY29388.1 hypothetical protein [Bacillus phage PK16]AUM58891.1 hypothetical protein BCP01_090 [Bacillus phage BCP01]UJH95600.1 hypothetical protein [Bacillus phage vB_BtM_BMBsp2]AHJ87234.1 hypothetical protein BCP8-2_196 [Bacillus phage BCP8-2]AID17866.1 hypothetical protein JBP901_gp154 [Bacillus phage JBP901]
MTNEVNKPSLNEEELALYANYVLTGKLEKEEDAEKINELASRTATLGDVNILARFIAGQAAQQITSQLVQVMEKVQIQEIVLEKLGANGKIFKDAKVKYNKQVDEAQTKLQEEYAKLEAMKQEAK